MRPTQKGDRVVPDSFQIIVNQYLRKLEVKSLAPDGTPCSTKTQGLLGRVLVVAGSVTPVGKETDRRWEQGEDPSMLDPNTEVYATGKKLHIADSADRKRWSAMGIRQLIRQSGLSQTTVYKILEGKPVRAYVLENFRRASGEIE
jgi:hypothetical protein